MVAASTGSAGSAPAARGPGWRAARWVGLALGIAVPWLLAPLGEPDAAEIPFALGLLAPILGLLLAPVLTVVDALTGHRPTTRTIRRGVLWWAAGAVIGWVLFWFVYVPYAYG
jgi:hypothetical protein